MRMTYRFARVVLSAVAMVATVTVMSQTAAPASADPGRQINTDDRASVIEAYRTWLLPQLTVPVGWTGSVNGCIPGSTSSQNHEATRRAVDYMRAMAGLPPVSWNQAFARRAQAAALVFTANARLSHTLDRAWQCWSKDAALGAARSNIGLTLGAPPGSLVGTTGARVVVLYMADDGEGNQSVGHRRWLLFPRLRTIGSGDSDVANALYVLARGKLPPNVPAFTPWPSAGYFPRELEPGGRWSVTYPGADFSRAQVVVSTDQGPLDVRQYAPTSGTGDNTIVWQMTLPAAYADTPAEDFPVHVSVTGVRVNRAPIGEVTWTTTLVQAGGDPPTVG